MKLMHPNVMHRRFRQSVCVGLALVVLAGGMPVVGLRHSHCLADRPHHYSQFAEDGCPHALEHGVHDVEAHWHYFWLGVEFGEQPAGDQQAPRAPGDEPIVAVHVAAEALAAELWSLPMQDDVSTLASVAVLDWASDDGAPCCCVPRECDAALPLCDAARLERSGVRLC